jgi:hypothetical protein
MALLLSRLILDAGGFTINNDGTLIDTGGLAVIRGILQSPIVGWESIEKVTGRTREDIVKKFSMWVTEIAAGRKSSPASVLDPWTSESLVLQPFMGAVYGSGYSAILSGPVSNGEPELSLAPYCIVWLPETIVGEKGAELRLRDGTSSEPLVLHGPLKEGCQGCAYAARDNVVGPDGVRSGA